MDDEVGEGVGFAGHWGLVGHDAEAGVGGCGVVVVGAELGTIAVGWAKYNAWLGAEGSVERYLGQLVGSRVGAGHDGYSTASVVA